jgi:hypothetical protein
MPSCSSSSNITGTSSVINPTGSQNRITLNLLGGSGEQGSTQNGYTLDSSINFAGAVIRYDPLNKTYRLSQANNNSNAEVVGIVESRDSSTNDLVVVLRGLINYPAGATLNYITDAVGGTTGGSGGNDIYFLSSATAGQVQNLEPIEPAEIAKPLIQAIGTELGFNYQVLNYIGYAVGGDIVADEFNGGNPLASSMMVPEDVEVPDGYVNADTENELVVVDYPDYYAYTGTNNGYVERVTIKTSSSVTSSLVNKNASQKSGGTVTSTGRILRVDTTNNKVDIRKSSTEPLTNLSNSISLNNVSYTPTSAEVYSVFTPRITSNQSFNYYENGRLVQKKLKIIYKIKNVGAVSVPQKVSVKEMNVTDRLTAGNSAASFLDVAEEITNIKSRLDSLENKINGSS